MLWKLLGGLAALGVAVSVIGSLAGLAPTLPANPAALAAVAVAALTMALVVGGGLAGRETAGNPYW